MSYNKEEYEAFASRMESTYPEMFVNPYGGFAVGAGWWPIIEALCRQIQHHVKWKQEQLEKYGRGEGCETVTVAQIKEKFGGLRFYYDGGDNVVDGMVRMAESWADHSCEECGAPGKRRSGGWVRTLCDEHEAEHQARYNERFKDEN
jgi:hypothetical protein